MRTTGDNKAPALAMARLTRTIGELTVRVRADQMSPRLKELVGRMIDDVETVVRFYGNP